MYLDEDEEVYLKIIEEVNEQRPDIPIVVVTNDRRPERVVEAMKAGAYDFIAKPIDYARLDRIIENALEHHHLEQENRYLQMENQRLRAQLTHEYDEIIGNSPKIVEALSLVEKVAKTDARVLILGESGTGKELFARAIHNTSNKVTTGKMVSQNCAAIPSELLESTLFGIDPGSGLPNVSKKGKSGKFMLAHNGTIFLDEIGDMALDLQPKILRATREFVITPIGGQDISVDVRIIAATNQPLEKMVEEGTFRLDLYQRLAEFTIHLPSLRERGEGDIELLTEHFVQKYSRNHKRQIKKCSQYAMELLFKYSWPGNVSELANKVSKAVILADDYEIELLPKHFPDLLPKQEPRVFIPSRITLEEWEWLLIDETFEKNNENKTQTAKDLGVSVRGLQKKLKRREAKKAKENHFDANKVLTQEH